MDEKEEYEKFLKSIKSIILWLVTLTCLCGIFSHEETPIRFGFALFGWVGTILVYFVSDRVKI